MEVLVFTVEGERWALPAADVRELVRAVAVSRLPGAPRGVDGVIDVRGELVPVLDLRGRLGLPARPVTPGEHFVIAHAGRTVAVRTDRAVEIATVDDSTLSDPRAAVPSAARVAAVARLPEGMVLIHDLGAFLDDAGAAALDAALAEARA